MWSHELPRPAKGGRGESTDEQSEDEHEYEDNEQNLQRVLGRTQIG